MSRNTACNQEKFGRWGGGECVPGAPPRSATVLGGGLVIGILTLWIIPVTLRPGICFLAMAKILYQFDQLKSIKRRYSTSVAGELLDHFVLFSNGRNPVWLSNDMKTFIPK